MTLDAGLRTVLGLAALVVVVAGLKLSSGLFLPLLSALFIAAVSTPVLSVLRERVRMPRFLAIALTCLLDVGVLAGVVALVGSSLSGFNEAIPRYRSALGELLDGVLAFFTRHGVPVERDDLGLVSDASAVMGLVAQLFQELTSIVSNALLVILLFVFMLFELDPFQRKLQVLLGSHADLGRAADAVDKVQRYLVMKTAISLLAGVLVGVWLALCGVDFPLLWGLLTFLLNYIPSIGPGIAMVPSVLVALLTLSPGAALAAFLGQFVIHMAVGNALEPRVMGEALGISTLVVFVSMLFWGWLWGPVGALFAVPLTMLLVSALEQAPETRWLAVVLASSEWVEAKRKEWGWLTVEEKRSAPGTVEAPAGPPREGEAVGPDVAADGGGAGQTAE